MFIKLGGPNGSGKTTIISHLVSFGQERGLPITSVHGGHILMKLAGVSSMEELRKIPATEREKLRPEMFKYMYEEDRQDPQTIRIRDCHFALYEPTNGSFVRGQAMPEDRKQMLMLAVLTPTAEQLYKRRLKENSERPDRVLNQSIIEMELQTELEYARIQAREIGKPLLELTNNEGFQNETAWEILTHLQRHNMNKEGARRASHETL